LINRAVKSSLGTPEESQSKHEHDHVKEFEDTLVVDKILAK
jgi:hypothetical protein